MIRRSALLVLMVLSWVVCMPSIARAAPPMGRQFGMGLIVGAPTGLTIKNYFDRQHALDAAIGLGWLGGNALQVHVDYLFHHQLTSTPHFDLPFYVGIGGKVAVWFSEAGGGYWGAKDGRASFGVRVPLGVSFELRRAPFDVFAEVVPGIGAWSSGVGFFIDAALGFRFYF